MSSFAKTMKDQADHQRNGSVAFGTVPGTGQSLQPVITTLKNEGGGSKRYIELLEKMKDLHIRKNAGYAGDNPDPWANFRISETFGIPAFMGVLVRMSDKWVRITNLVKNPANDKVGESIKDTLFDLAAYALIAIAILEEKEDA